MYIKFSWQNDKFNNEFITKLHMQTCYNCKSKLKNSISIKEGVELNCLRCSGCGEEFFRAGELIKFDVMTGRRER